MMLIINVFRNLQELAQIIVEILQNAKDRALVIQVCSRIYQNNPDFPEILIQKLPQQNK